MLQNERTMHQPNPGVFISSCSSSSSTMSTGKTSWPELVGTQTNPGLVIINHDRSDVAIEGLPDGVKVPKDFNAKRVRGFFDAKESQGLVIRTPVVG